MLTNADGKIVNIDGLRTFYFQTGSGCPVVLIHGASPGACSVTSWQLNLEPLARAGFAVYAFDQPGFGMTDNPQDHSIEFRVKHARAFVDAMRFDRYHVVGNSVGGYIAARLALEDPRVASFTTTTSGTLAPRGSAASQALGKAHGEELRAYTPSVANMRKLTRGTIFHKELITDELVELRYDMSSGKNHEAQLARQDVPSPRPIHDELKHMRQKSLLLWGKNDSGVTVERGLLLFDLIPGAEFHLFDRCAHWVQWDQADRFNNLIVNFVGETK
jgi:pimeloyl-ACP methyl ester carboxylesterase